MLVLIIYTYFGFAMFSTNDLFEKKISLIVYQYFITFDHFKGTLNKFFTLMKTPVSYTIFISMVIYIVTPCPSAPVKCAPVASPVNKFAEMVSPDPNYASSANK